MSFMRYKVERSGSEHVVYKTKMAYFSGERGGKKDTKIINILYLLMYITNN